MSAAVRGRSGRRSRWDASVRPSPRPVSPLGASVRRSPRPVSPLDASVRRSRLPVSPFGCIRPTVGSTRLPPWMRPSDAAACPSRCWTRPSQGNRRPVGPLDASVPRNRSTHRAFGCIRPAERPTCGADGFTSSAGRARSSAGSIRFSAGGVHFSVRRTRRPEGRARPSTRALRRSVRAARPSRETARRCRAHSQWREARDGPCSS